MTKICFIQKNGRNVGFVISGHTGKAEYGKDILCSAISASSQMAVLAITEVAMEKADVKMKDGFLSLMLSKPTKQTDLVLTSLQKTLEAICANEKKYVKLEVRNDI